MINEWTLKISKVDNGYILEGDTEDSEGYTHKVVEEIDDELAANEKLLWAVMEYFSFMGSKHDPERLRVVRQKKQKED